MSAYKFQREENEMSFWNLFSKNESAETDKKSTDTITAPKQTVDELFELGKQYLNKDDL